MRAGLSKLNNEFDGIISEMSLEDVKKIYYKKTYQNYTILWIDNNLKLYNEKEAKLIKFIEKLDYPQRQACLLEEGKALNQVIFDLTVKHRKETLSETINFISAIHCEVWSVEMVHEYLTSYTLTGNKEDLNNAMEYLSKWKSKLQVNEFNAPKQLENMKEYVNHLLNNNEDLTKQNIKQLNFLNDYVDIQQKWNNIKK